MAIVVRSTHSVLYRSTPNSKKARTIVNLRRLEEAGKNKYSDSPSLLLLAMRMAIPPSLRPGIEASTI